MSLNQWWSNFQEQVAVLSPARRGALAAASLGSLAFFLWIAFSFGGADERLLFRNLESDEAARVVEGLRAEKISYRLAEGGGTIYVPAAQVHEARIRLAGRGLPGGGSPGFEIFDKTGFGVSDFVNRVNFQRALQGEMARSIEQLESVERARVQVAIPERRGFVSSRSNPASASVVIRLRPGAELAPGQARGVVHLVASSVEGLDPTRVTVVDDRGRLLAPDPDGTQGPAPSGAMKHQARLENELAGRIESILEPTVGVGRVVARVTAQLDWTQTEFTEERFDPDSQVARSEEVMQESSADGIDVAGGVPGAAANDPDQAAPGADGPGSQSTRISETINYEISKVTSRTVTPVGTVTQLDVAVLVDGMPTEDGSFAPWPQEKLEGFEELAKRAVGFSVERGDLITVSNGAFQTIDVEEGGPGLLTPELLLLLSNLFRLAGVIVAVLVFAKLVARPLAENMGAPLGAELPARVGDLEVQLSGASGAAAAQIPAPEPVAQPRQQQPEGPESEEAVKAVRAWLNER
ncbi:MAG: flagellar basal-body MS-ring/collar protein FliF [Myxococcota bacterium]|nr:flagellar basal-body MS-ring/collar protein FliF [Myxococcota bacterium]